MRFGIIGCGRIAPRHAKYISEIDGVDLVAVADINKERANSFSEEYNSDCYYDYRELLDRKDIDVINICTPSGLHSRMSIEAMEAGKHVIVEKPMALSLLDADAMISTSKKTRKKMCITLQNRYNPPMQKLREAVDENLFGKILMGNATVRWYRPQSYYEDGWHGTWAMDGGALMNQSIHHIDALQWFMGEVDHVYAETNTFIHRMEAEDAGVAVITFKDKRLATVEGSTITYPKNLEASLSLFGEKGSVKIGGTALNRFEFWKVEGHLDEEKEILGSPFPNPSSVYGYSHKLVIEDMIKALINDNQPQTNGYEGRKSLAIVLAMYESSRSGLRVKL